MERVRLVAWLVQEPARERAIRAEVLTPTRERGSPRILDLAALDQEQMVHLRWQEFPCREVRT